MKPPKKAIDDGSTAQSQDGSGTRRADYMEIVVDAYGEQERAMGWYYYLEGRQQFPFTARCLSERAISPLRDGGEAEVIGMVPEIECEKEMFVSTRWERKGRLAVPLAQLKVKGGDASTRTAVEDWHYWLKQGYVNGFNARN
ncbi:MAG: calcium-binding protein [Phycisphaerales bacterium]|nr:calcium-binding protein [Phycisphaerales bacterium]